MTRTLCVALAAASTFLATLAHAASPEPWSDPDPAAPPVRTRVGDYGFRGAAEYRAQGVYVSPIDLTSETDRRASWLEHRLRLDGTLDYLDKIRVTTSIDALDGVLWGDNGNLGTEPEPTSGAHVNTNNPNDARVCVALRPGESAVSASSYHYGICPAESVFVRRLFGDVMTPVGLLRIGRQPFTEGAGVAVNDGDGRRNRFGISGRGNTADRILFATKPLEAFKAKGDRDASAARGLFLILAYDHLVTDRPQSLRYGLHEWITAVRFLEPRLKTARDVELRLFHTYRWDEKYDTAVNAIGGRASAAMGDFYAGFDATGIVGSTREVSEAFHVITNDPVVSQAIRQVGVRAVVRYDRPLWSGYLETDYASGASDPLNGALTQFRFAEDTNVGLLMFKRVFAYQTARAAAAASALLQSLNAPTIPVESIDTRGAFTNAVALFPQVDVHPLPNILLRGGVLMAWAPQSVFDPVATQQRRAANAYQNAQVNFNGGAPTNYYGTEIDGRFQWRYLDHFAFDLEAAVLFPGSALEDEDHHAVRSVLVQGRSTFFF